MSLKAKLATLAVAILIAQPALAVVVIQPIGITDNALGTSQGSAQNLINQSGLSTGYTTGVTDYAVYLAQSPTHANPNVSNGWVSANGTTSGNIDFDLGGLYSLQNFALWNGVGGLGMNSFTLFIDDNSIFSSPFEVGTFIAAQVSAPSPLQNFSFAEMMGSNVRMRVNSHHSTGQFVSLGEVAFGGTMGQTVVPEPASAALLGLGLLGFGVRRRIRGQFT